MVLAPYACDPEQSRGRRYNELAAPTRNAFQRDRDRIVHSTAFRRLVYKTQVFLNHEGDLFRTRLTHSLEVAQLGRSVARALSLNEDLVEAIALAHDLGHTPFGHAGQDVLNACMADYGGFEHNSQSLRVVDELEECYPQFNGINLCFETREGILKHCNVVHAQKIEAREPGGVASRFLLGRRPSLEAQLCNLADEIAYNAHDIDDGVRSGLITLEQLEGVPFFGEFDRQVVRDFPALADQALKRRRLFETIRRMLSAQVYDLIAVSREALNHYAPSDVDAVRELPPLIAFSAEMRQRSVELKRFLFANLYRHPQVMATTQQAKQVVRELFAIYVATPSEIPLGFTPDACEISGPLDPASRHARVVADYIAGMTDRFAAKEHTRLTGVQLLV